MRKEQASMNDNEYSQITMPDGGRYFLLSVQSVSERCRGAICDLSFGMQETFSGIYGVMSALDEMMSATGLKPKRPSVPKGFGKRSLGACQIHIRYCRSGSWQGDVMCQGGLQHFCNEKELMQLLKSAIPSL